MFISLLNYSSPDVISIFSLQNCTTEKKKKESLETHHLTGFFHQKFRSGFIFTEIFTTERQYFSACTGLCYSTFV